MKLYKLFVKYCVRYFMAFLVVLACCFLLAGVAYRSVEDTVILANRLKLQDGVTGIHQNILQLDRVARVISRDTYFGSISRCKSNLPPEEYLYLKYANEQLNGVGMLYPLAGYGFTLFRDNSLYISTGQCAEDYFQYYGKFLQVSSGGPLSALELKSRLFELGRVPLSFWRVDSAQYSLGGQDVTVRDAILCVAGGNTMFGSSPPHVMVFVLHPEDLMERILMQAQSVESGMVRIVSREDGSELLSCTAGGEPAEWDSPDIEALTYQVPELGWEVTAGIPRSVIDEQCREIRVVIAFYTGIGLLLVLGLTLFFSFRQYSNVKRLFFRLPDTDRVLGKGQNEYDVLCGVMSDVTENRREYEEQVAALTKQNEAILLEKLIVHGLDTPQEQRQFERYFARPLEYFCVALAEVLPDQAENHHLAVLCMVQFFHQRLPCDFANVHTGTNGELFLISLRPQDAPNVQNVRRLFEEITAALTEDMGLTFNVGISAIGTDLANINTCYNQARQVTQAFGRENQNSVEVYSIDINLSQENMVSVEFLDKLYTYLLCAQREAIRAQFGRLESYYQKMTMQYEMNKQQIFFSIRNVVYSAYLRAVTRPQDLADLPDYRESMSVEELAQSFLRAAERFCDLVEENRRSHNSELRERILRYIGEHYATAALTAGTVCHEIGISEKYLSQFLKEQTGETFSGYLERIRIEAAIGYLTTTGLSNEKIAEMTGFAATNTFYRAFHKRTGVSPGTYRANH